MPDAELAKTERSASGRDEVGAEVSGVVLRSMPEVAGQFDQGLPDVVAVGRVRLSYRWAAEVARTGSGDRTLHQLAPSRLTHLAEAGVPGPVLMAKSRHGSVKTLNLYV